MIKASIRDLTRADLAGRTALVRADLNAPLEHGRIADETRIRESIPTLRYLRDAGARVLVMSHFGRPKGVDPTYSLRLVAEHLSDSLGGVVLFVPELVGPQ